MSRYRPPRPRSSPYITRTGYDRLQQELTYLWKEKRPEVTRKVAEAAAQGDRSENAEYIYGKRQLREIDSRIQFLSKRLDDLVVVDQLPKERDRIFFGAWITLETEAGEQHLATEYLRESALNRLTEMASSFVAPERLRAAAEEQIPWPDVAPAFTQAVAGADGHLWLRRGVQADSALWEVWHADGHIREVLMPAALEMKYADAEELWGVMKNSTGVPFLFRYRLTDPAGR